jgi:hypothetical protein
LATTNRAEARCFVYISEISTRKQKTSNMSTDCTWESAFRVSEWFTRGWTFQELLAPRSVEFFSPDGERLEDKESLKWHIWKITRITVLALEGNPLSQFQVEERLSWVENRETARREDRVKERAASTRTQSQSCIQDIRTTDPREDKKRIEATNGGLLRDSYQWILENPHF